jgi:subtilisin family serine protease
VGIGKGKIIALIGLAVLALSRPARSVLPGSWTSHVHTGDVHYVAGELIVRYKEGVTAAEREEMLSHRSLNRIKTIPGLRLEHVRISGGRSVEAAIAEFNADPRVEFAQPNFIYQASAVPNDPLFNQSWALNNTGQTVTDGDIPTNNPGAAGADLGVEKAWDLVTDCSKVPVAVVDSGVNYLHEDLAANMWDGGTQYPKHGYNFVDGNDDPMDLLGHGTHVAGIIGAAGNNGLGIAGICWKASIMAVRALDASGAGTSANIAAALDFARTNGARVVNLSFGGPNQDPGIRSAIQALSDQGAVIVAAAGNNSSDNDSTPVYPCDYNVPGLICVAALDQAYQLASYSNYGGTTVHLAAPGTNILSSFAGVSHSALIPFQSASWTSNSNQWAQSMHTVMSGGSQVEIDMLTNPSNWDGTSAKYASNSDARVYTNYDLTGAVSAKMSVVAIYDIASGDAFNVGLSPTGGDPFAGGASLDHITGSSSGSSRTLVYDMSACMAATCSFGFQLKSAAGPPGLGVGVAQVIMTRLNSSTSAYVVLDGTSMAGPHVTGIVALLLAYNPAFSASDAIQALTAGARPIPALTNKTVTGAAADAFGALSYITAPSGAQAQVN